MLFRTVYGPELESVFLWVQRYGPMRMKNIFEAFGTVIYDSISSTANIEDALQFLKASGLISENEGLWEVKQECRGNIKFKTYLLGRLRHIQITKEQKGVHLLDPYFLKLIDFLFIQPDILFLSQLHTKINSADIPLPCGEEKVNAWRRVHEYLGVGVRGFNGLLVQYDKQLILDIVEEWVEDRGPLQVFMEEHFDKYLPWKTEKGDIAKAVSIALERLEEEGVIYLEMKQDLPSKSYLGERKIKWISKERRE